MNRSKNMKYLCILFFRRRRQQGTEKELHKRKRQFSARDNFLAEKQIVSFSK